MLRSVCFRPVHAEATPRVILKDDYSDGRNPMRYMLVVGLLTLGVVSTAAAQKPDPLLGTWEAKTKEGIHTVVIRSDSSASYGEETVRWRVIARTMWLALGGEWVDYDMKLRGKRLTLSGGDLAEPITLTRIGPPSPRPATVAVPPDPDQEVSLARKAKGSGAD